ncbi:MAG: ATP-binding protein, partial [bacterium]
TGSGISAADLPNVFKRFFRGASSRSEIPGNGLGLAIVEQVVKLHSGTTTVSSIVGRGTTITLDFPITKV